MATTPRGDNPALRAAVIEDMARRVAQVRMQRTKMTKKTGLAPSPRHLMVRRAPLNQGLAAK